MHVGDTIFIFCLALIIFGPKKLPEIGRQIGKLMVEFRRASNEFKMQIEDELRAAEEADRQKEITAAATALPSPAVTSTLPEPVVSAEADSATPVIQPPSTGLPVNHTFSSSETSVVEAAVEAASGEAYPEAAEGFNPGLNTASNGLAAETSLAEPVSFAPEADQGLPEATQGAEPTVSPDSEKAHAPVHHG